MEENQSPRRIATGTLYKMEYTITQEDQMYRLNWNRTINGRIENCQKWFHSFSSTYNELTIAVNEYVELIENSATLLDASESQALHNSLKNLFKGVRYGNETGQW